MLRRYVWLRLLVFYCDFFCVYGYTATEGLNNMLCWDVCIHPADKHTRTMYVSLLYVTTDHSIHIFNTNSAAVTVNTY
jgi:hypothetical protein